jgi:hypothetical protein
MKPVLDVLALLGEIEWARPVGSEAPETLRPPFLAWRFKSPEPQTEAAIVRAVEMYKGQASWVIEKGERNWVIGPAEFQKFSRGFRRDVEALQAFGQEFPSETRTALADATRLAEYLRRELLPH